MSSRIEQLRDLEEMLERKRISESEYEALRQEILDDAPDNPPPLEEAVKAARRTSSNTQPEETSTQIDWIAYVGKVPKLYLFALGVGVLAAFFSWSMWPLAWIAAVFASVALVATESKRGRWMAWLGLAIGCLFAVINLLADPPGAAAGPPAPPVPSVVADPEPPADSLGVSFDTLADDWNAVALPPLIRGALRPTPEAGELDSFLHRFDGSAVLADAFDPAGGWIYALMARMDLRHESISNMYVHLCSLIHPASQGCLDVYIEENGMFGKSALDFIDAEHDVSWVFEGNQWRLTIYDDVQTIRVQSPQGAD